MFYLKNKQNYRNIWAQQSLVLEDGRMASFIKRAEVRSEAQTTSKEKEQANVCVLSLGISWLRSAAILHRPAFKNNKTKIQLLKHLI